MLRRNGDLFHIDFGHILGNYKSFHGIKKETTPFVFTTMYSTVMDGEGSPAFIKFTKFCAQAYNTVRKHGHILMILFTFMLSCGIPELPDEAALLWLRNCLILEKTDPQAGELFTQLIHLALTNTRTRLNDFIHIFVHSTVVLYVILTLCRKYQKYILPEEVHLFHNIWFKIKKFLLLTWRCNRTQFCFRLTCLKKRRQRLS